MVLSEIIVSGVTFRNQIHPSPPSQILDPPLDFVKRELGPWLLYIGWYVSSSLIGHEYELYYSLTAIYGT